uniref:Cyclin_C domain-containing protein n=1 Tax=Caenorhabditis tropicalis TaxID=1561998 RepID=A0A1I7SZK5_9PELO
MNGRTTVLIPGYSRKESTETVLSNSQSPSFVIFRTSSEISEKIDDEIEIIHEVKIRNVEKRVLVKSPKCRKETNESAPKKLKKESAIGDYGCQIRENEKRMKAITGLHIDLLEMYTILCLSASLIPVPHTLLSNDNAPSSRYSDSKTCSNFSIEDRKRVLLKVFASRHKLKVSSETLHLGAAILDKCLDRMTVRKETLGELAAVSTAIASKVEDINHLTLGNLIETKLIEKRPLKMIASLERLVLVSLSFKVTTPTPLNFATYMLVHLSAPQLKRNLTHYFLELSILYVHNRLFASDVVAYAATCLAFAMATEPGKSVSKVLRETEFELRVFTDKNYLVKRKQSQEVMRTMLDLFVVAPAENHSIFREYSTNRQNNVALRQIDPSLQELLRIDSI